MIRTFQYVAFTAVSAWLVACGAGGTNDVNLVGANHGEEPGAKSPSGKIGLGESPSTTVGTIAALCVQACSHLRAANCEMEPAYKSSECIADCATSSGGAGTAAECDDELVKYYNCVVKAAVECSSVGQPRVACGDQNDAYEACLDHGGTEKYPGCVNVPGQDYMCQQYYVPNYKYYQCSSSSSPNASCMYVHSNAFCCP